MSIEWDEVSEDETTEVGETVVAELIPFVDETELAGVVDISQPLTETEARELTEHIRSVADALYVLIARAHAGRAWEPLGYNSFADYVRAEFDISKSRAYQLLDQAKVVAEITAAAPDGTQINITEAAARDLKHVIGELAPDIAEATANVDPDDAAGIIEELIEDYRNRDDDNDESDEEEDNEYNGDYTGNGNSRNDEEDDEDFSDIDALLDSDSDDLRRRIESTYALFTSLSALRNMPEPAQIIEWIQEGRRPQIAAFLPGALDWIQRFASEWDNQPWADQLAEIPEETDEFSAVDGDDELFEEFQN